MCTMAWLRGAWGVGSAARSSFSADLPQAGSAMCGYRGKRRARSLTGGIDSLLDVRGESVVSLPSLSSGDLQGDGLEGASSPEAWLHTAAVMCASRFVAAGLPSTFTCVVTVVVRHAMTYSPLAPRRDSLAGSSMICVCLSMRRPLKLNLPIVVYVCSGEFILLQASVDLKNKVNRFHSA